MLVAQNRTYSLALENPPLLFVSDMVRIRIRTNWTNSVSRGRGEARGGRPGSRSPSAWRPRSRPWPKRCASAGTTRRPVAHFVNRLVFCTLPDHMFPGRPYRWRINSQNPCVVVASAIFAQAEIDALGEQHVEQADAVATRAPQFAGA